MPLTYAEEVNLALTRELCAASPADALQEIRRLRVANSMLAEMLRALPSRRDWLDPEVEAMARVATGVRG